MEGAVYDLCDWINLMELEEEEVRADLKLLEDMGMKGTCCLLLK